MCNLSEALIEDTRRETIEDTRRETVVKLLSKGKTPEEIESLLDYPLSMIEDVQAELDKDQ